MTNSKNGGYRPRANSVIHKNYQTPPFLLLVKGVTLILRTLADHKCVLYFSCLVPLGVLASLREVRSVRQLRRLRRSPQLPGNDRQKLPRDEASVALISVVCRSAVVLAVPM
jgi:hypothetical protein